MIDSLSVVAVITARGGSKGLPRKNVLPAAGKPLIAWTIEAAHQAIHVDRTILSSDDDEIISVARQWGCEVPFIRPPELSGDTARSEDAVLDALDRLDRPYDVVVLLQPTSPQRLAVDIDQCLKQLVDSGAPSCVSICPVSKPPEWMFRLAAGGVLSPILGDAGRGKRRQDLPPCYTVNGAVYAAHVDWLRRTRCFFTDETVGSIMPAERSLDIDTAQDLRIFEALHP
ncbi:acylneuraminate cytidylyltransferase family protein [Magnetospirillum sp. 64-120]|uniref:acylneuraminate cytidylyltransferase family protein n=1 Tax=Magnetospirillum sp. 64-120 TaxID=1895778 RepID=UPI00092AC95B|nr:acylneuraminate cytidylyltransferase family protein [Magnetospirillum sp. 64-120]OJX68275.1 MAG: acylneuraminate cytidylyltransferase [Magnetospirillum sp. 64-120]